MKYLKISFDQVWGYFFAALTWDETTMTITNKKKIKQLKNLLLVLHVFFGLESFPGKKEKWSGVNETKKKFKSKQYNVLHT